MGHGFNFSRSYKHSSVLKNWDDDTLVTPLFSPVRSVSGKEQFFQIIVVSKIPLMKEHAYMQG